MYVASILALALVCATQTHGFSEKAVFCQTNALNQATYNFINFIGFPGAWSQSNASALWKTYYPLAYFLNQQVSATPGSINGFYTVCNGFEQLWGMLLGFGNQNCLTAENLINGMTVDPGTAFSVVGLLNKYKFICGAGFYTLLRERNIDCVQRVIANFNTTFALCLATYQANVQHDPTSACRYIGDFTSCNALVFNTSACTNGNNVDFWWGCEGSLQFALAQFPSCRHARSCTINRSPFGIGGFERELMEYSKTHYKFENGQHWFKLPDIFKEINGKWVLSENDWVTG
uniref:Uncharacterized protein n=1 Tax=Acrobeloides nanus TaxID=290746 RepID=A0A914CS57_9BILA